MKNCSGIMAVVAGLLLTTAAPSTAQTTTTPMFSVDVNVGGQTQSRTFTSATSFPLYLETANISTGQAVSGGGVYDLRLGYRWHNLGVAIGVSSFSAKGEATLAASVPNPVVFGKPAITNLTSSDLKRTEIGTHVSFVYFLQPVHNVEVNAFVGPSFFRVKQEVLGGSVVAGTQNLTTAITTEAANGNGVNAGINANYFFRPRYGAGVYMQYAGGSADLPTIPDAKAGGFQLGGGLRLRF
jgi:hypothetical protein